MKTSYRITSCLLIGDFEVLLSSVFPSWNGEPSTYSGSEITVTFAEPQTPADLGPLVKIEIIPNP